jgi:hypothetical protein
MRPLPRCRSRHISTAAGGKRDASGFHHPALKPVRVFLQSKMAIIHEVHALVGMNGASHKNKLNSADAPRYGAI